jgi:hypothetical protein
MPTLYCLLRRAVVSVKLLAPSALGLEALQLALPRVLHLVSSAHICVHCTVTTCRYVLIPLGSSTKIARVDGARTLTHYNLFSDESFSLFPRRNFNMALKAFLQCVDEAGTLLLLR